MERRFFNRKTPPFRSYGPVLLLFSLFYLVFRELPGARHGRKFSLTSTLLDSVSPLSDFFTFPTFDEKLKIAVIECPGGTDKAPDGHREDSKFLLDGITSHEADAKLFQYTDNTFDAVFKEITSNYRAHAYVSRVDPGEYEACDEETYFAFLDKLIEADVIGFNSPSDMLNLGSKKSLLNLAGMYYFPNSTYVYSSIGQFDAFFPRTLKLHESRVIKQNRGSKGEGVWWVKLLDSNYQGEVANKRQSQKASFNPFSRDYLVSRFLSLPFVSMFQSENPYEDAGWESKSPVPLFYDKLLPDFTLASDNCSNLDIQECFDETILTKEKSKEMDKILVKLVEAKDNHQEEMTLKQFRNSVIKGYLNSSEDFVVDMEYLPRIAEGEVRLILSGKEVLFVVNKQPHVDDEDGAFSANLGAGAEHKWEPPENWTSLVDPFMENMEQMLEKMNVQHAPILWTVDFIRYGEASQGEKDGTEDSSKSHFVISEINSSCVGFSAHPEMGEVIAKILIESVTKLLLQ